MAMLSKRSQHEVMGLMKTAIETRSIREAFEAFVIIMKNAIEESGIDAMSEVSICAPPPPQQHVEILIRLDHSRFSNVSEDGRWIETEEFIVDRKTRCGTSRRSSKS